MSAEKYPRSLRVAKLGRLPFLIRSSTMSGERPSSPRTMTRSKSESCLFRDRTFLKTYRNGQKRSDKKARKNVKNNTKNEEIKAKPAPGPI